MTRRSTPEDFWSKLSGRQDPDACWLWGGALCEGYGRLSYEGKRILSHRLAYKLVKGDIPEGMLVLHSCDEPKCCNPAHLRSGTDADNSLDRKARKRHWADRGMRALQGSANPMAKLSESDVGEIWRLRALGKTARSISQELGLRQYNVAAVISGATWKHLKPTK